MSRIIIEIHKILGLCENDFGESGELITMDCLSNTFEIIDPEKDIRVTSEICGLIGHRSKHRTTRDIRRLEDTSTESEIISESIIEFAIVSIRGPTFRINGKGLRTGEGEFTGDGIEAEREPRQSRPFEQTINGIHESIDSIIAIRNNDGSGDGGRAKGHPESDIPAIGTEDEIIIGEFDGSDTNPQNIPDRCGETEIEIGGGGAFHGNTESTIDIDNMFDNIVSVQSERKVFEV